MMVSSALVAGWLVSLAHLSLGHADELAAPIAEVSTTLEDAAILAVTIDAEGGVRRSVMTCKVLGDHGHAFGGYQLHRWHIRGPLEEFCRDPRLQAEMALRALGSGSTVRARIASFMGRRENDKEVSRRVTRYERLLAGDKS